MDRRIRVKCPDCAASIELRVDLEELLDVTCPRCQHLFTAKVPPPVLDIAPVEVEPIPEERPVRRTRVVKPKIATGPKTSNPLPPSVPAPPPVDSNWFDPVPPYDSSLQVSFATHVKAVLIATGSIIGLGLLVMFGFIISSTVSNTVFTTAGDETKPTTTTEPLASGPITTAPTDETTELTTAETPTFEVTSLAGSPPLATASSLPEVTSTNSVVEAATGTIDSMPAGGSKPKRSDIAEKIILLANQIVDATKDSDNEFILDRTHPKLIQLAGGRSKMLEILNEALEPMKTQGISIANYTVSNEIVVRQVGQKVFAVLPTTLDLRYPGRTMRTEGFLLAVSEDAGQTYSFIDGAGAAKNRSVLKQIIPDLPDDLALPPASTPREVPQ